MAFTLQTWTRSSTSANEPVVTLTSGALAGCFRTYSYYTADAQFTVSTANYFDAVINDLGVGDLITVYSSLTVSSVTYLVTSVTTHVTILAVGAGSVSGQLSAAQIIAMYAAPVAIASLPAPGAGYAYLVNRFTLNKLAGTVDYTGGGAISLEYGNTAHAGGTLATGTIAAALLTGTAATTTFGTANGSATEAASSTFANLGIFISNDTAAFAAGDSLVNYTIQYRAVAVS